MMAAANLRREEYLGMKAGITCTGVLHSSMRESFQLLCHAWHCQPASSRIEYARCDVMVRNPVNREIDNVKRHARAALHVQRLI